MKNVFRHYVVLRELDGKERSACLCGWVSDWTSVTSASTNPNGVKIISGSHPYHLVDTVSRTDWTLV